MKKSAHHGYVSAAASLVTCGAGNGLTFAGTSWTTGGVAMVMPGMSAIDVDDADAGADRAAAGAAGSTTVNVPFMPASLWPGIEQMNSRTPGLSNVYSPVVV